MAGARYPDSVDRRTSDPGEGGSDGDGERHGDGDGDAYTHTHIHTYTRIVQIMILTDPSQWVMLFDALKAETRKSTEKHVHVYCSAADVRFDD